MIIFLLGPLYCWAYEADFLNLLLNSDLSLYCEVCKYIM